MGGIKKGDGRKVPTGQCYTTHNEINFLDKFISTRSEYFQREKFLKKYIKRIKQRGKWGTFDGVNIPEVVSYAEKLIAADN